MTLRDKLKRLEALEGETIGVLSLPSGERVRYGRGSLQEGGDMFEALVACMEGREHWLLPYLRAEDVTEGVAGLVRALEGAPMGLRDRIKRLKRVVDEETVEVVCPECGAEFKATGDDPVLEFLCYEWQQVSGGESYRKTPADVLAIAAHEHDPSLMINKATSKPWCGELLAGTVRLPDDVPDLSEQAKTERGEV